MDKTSLNLLGKDYFTEVEAAHYAGVSPRQFRDKAPEYGITPFKFMGKKLYSKRELSSCIERLSVEASSESTRSLMAVTSALLK